jgi:hypothetical protein
MFDYGQYTYRNMAKWMCGKMDMKVEFDDNSPPYYDIRTKTIHIPHSPQDGQEYTALSIVLHEAAHARYSTQIKRASKLLPGMNELLNLVEDARIDTRVMRTLPNIKKFYSYLYTNTAAKGIQANPNLEEWKKNATSHLYAHLGFKTKLNKKMTDRLNARMEFQEAIRILDNFHYYGDNGRDEVDKELREAFDNLKKALKYTPPQEQKPPPPQGEGDGKGRQPDDCSGQGDKEGKGDKDQDSKDQNSKDKEQSKGKHPCMAGTGWDDVFKIDDLPCVELPNIMFEESTRQMIKDILDKKIKVIEPDGTRLDTDNLMEYFVGDVEKLFNEEEIRKQKKAKIKFLVDESGSMSDRVSAMDKSNKAQLTRAVIKTIVEVVEECRLENLEVEYEIVGFETELKHYKDLSEYLAQYGARGGTDLSGCATKLLKAFAKEDNVAKKIVVIVTDGRVGADDINEMRELLKSMPSEIKVCLFGIGDKMPAESKDLIGEDRVIVSTMNADMMVANAISEAL